MSLPSTEEPAPDCDARDRVGLGLELARPGDKILVSGSVGDHGTAVMLAREQKSALVFAQPLAAGLLLPVYSLRKMPVARSA